MGAWTGPGHAVRSGYFILNRSMLIANHSWNFFLPITTKRQLSQVSILGLNTSRLHIKKDFVYIQIEEGFCGNEEEEESNIALQSYSEDMAKIVLPTDEESELREMNYIMALHACYYLYNACVHVKPV